jgi:spore germination protein KB
MTKPQITSGQLLFMTVGSALVFPYTFMPILKMPPANQDAWLVLLFAGFYVILLNTPMLFLINRFRGISVNDMLSMIYGKVFGALPVILLALFSLYCLTACMLITAVFINLYAFPDTPMWALLLISLAPVSYGAYKGAGTIGRLAFFVTPLILLTILFFFFLGLKDLRLDAFTPVLADSTFLKLNLGGFLTAARYSEILIVLVFSYYLKQHMNINKAFLASLGVFLAAFALILVPTMAHLGVNLGKHVWNPYFVYTRQVEGYDFIERVQAFNMLAWFPTSLLKLMIYNFMGSFVLSKLFRTKSHKGFVLPLSLICAVICLIPMLSKPSTVELLRSDKVFPFVVIPVIWILPLITVLVYAIRRRKLTDRITELKKKEAAAQAPAQPAPEPN